MSDVVPPLLGFLSEVPDFRSSQGRRHPLPAILSMACAAILCGYRTYPAIAEWGRTYGRDVVRSLGFTHEKTPCAATLHTVFRGLDRQKLEARLSEWAEYVVGVLAAKEGAEEADGAEEAVAIDGKTLRGSRRQQAPGVHLLSAVSHRLGITLGQTSVDDKTNEITAVQELLQGLVLEGRVVTVDALLTQKEVARTILQKGGTT
jgi:hypothetical protein